MDERFWMRMGNQDRYHWSRELSGVVERLRKANVKGRTIQWYYAGLAALPDFTGHNYISLMAPRFPKGLLWVTRSFGEAVPGICRQK